MLSSTLYLKPNINNQLRDTMWKKKLNRSGEWRKVKNGKFGRKRRRAIKQKPRFSKKGIRKPVCHLRIRPETPSLNGFYSNFRRSRTFASLINAIAIRKKSIINFSLVCKAKEKEKPDITDMTPSRFPSFWAVRWGETPFHVHLSVQYTRLSTIFYMQGVCCCSNK